MILYNGVRFPLSFPCPANVRRLDLGCLPMIESMNANGILLDTAKLSSISSRLSLESERLDAEIKSLVGSRINPESGDQVARLLFDELGLPPSKLTRKQLRYSVDDDVLSSLLAHHPVVKLIADHREAQKLKTTYADALPLLVSPDGRIRTTLKATTARTGRLASENPNCQNIPIRSEWGMEIRKAFVARPGWKLVSCDLCLHPDTLVQTLTGAKAISELKTGDKVLTKKGGRISYGEVSRSSASSPLPAYRLAFDNGESVVASRDHRWPIQRRGKPGQYEKTTAELSLGERMVPCRVGRTGRGESYLTWYSSKGATVHTKQHILVAEAYHGPRPEGCHVHHKDGNRQNNLPENLEYKNGSEHWSDHGRENYQKQDHTLRLEKLREGLKRRRSYVGVENPNAKLSLEDRAEIVRCALQGEPANRIAPRFGISYGHTRKVIREALYTENHELVGKEYVGVQPMHTITVEPDHNYVLACGVVTYNSQVEMRVAAHESEDPALALVFVDGLDIHTFTAVNLFQLDETDILRLVAGERAGTLNPADAYRLREFKLKHRLPAKTLGFAVLYGVTASGLQIQILAAGGPLIPLDECQRYIDRWFDLYAEVRFWMERQFQRARLHGMVWDFFGRFRLVPEVRSALRGVQNEGLRQAGNHPIQSAAQGILKLAMAEVHYEVLPRYGADALPVLQIHDELLFEAREEVAEDLAQEVKRVMSTVVPLLVPVESSSDVAETWGDLK